MKPIIRLLASSPTLEKIQEQINAFYCSTGLRVDPETLAIIKADGTSLPSSVRVIKRAGRYRFEQVISLAAISA